MFPLCGRKSPGRVVIRSPEHLGSQKVQVAQHMYPYRLFRNEMMSELACAETKFPSSGFSNDEGARAREQNHGLAAPLCALSPAANARSHLKTNFEPVYMLYSYAHGPGHGFKS